MQVVTYESPYRSKGALSPPPKSTPHNRVVLVGCDGPARALELGRRLEAHGFHVVEVPSARYLSEPLARRTRATIVVYNPKPAGEARETLERLARAQRSSPVVVLVNHVNFGDYMRLMNDGAIEYFELGEGADAIVRGIEWADWARAC